MSDYFHGIRVVEEATTMVTKVEGTAGLQVIFGTAPVNLAENPQAAVNVPILCRSFSECQSALGYSDDFENYTLCESMYTNFKVFNVEPVIFVNVLDPAKHVKENELAEVTVTAKQALVKTKGILKDSVVVKNAETPLVADTDYLLSFDNEGYLVITMVTGGAGERLSSVKVESRSINPAAVTEDDLIGGYDAETGAETGIETVRQIYPRFSYTPGLLLAPRWSKKPTVAAVLAAKCEKINGVFRCECLIDLDTAQATSYAKCKEIKESSGLSDAHQAVLWPMVKIGDYILSYSAVFGAMVAYTDAVNDDVPNLAMSNRLLKVSGTVLEDGTEIMLDQNQAAVLNGQGIITALNDSGWRSWGNNMACFPGNTDPKDRWLNCRRFFSWWGNSFILTYKNRVDRNADKRLIEDICDSENVRGNSYVSQGKCAGFKIEYRAEDNTIDNILNGEVNFRMYLAQYTPAEAITNTLSFDPSLLEAALTGGE